MEERNTQTITYQSQTCSIANFDGSELDRQRLDFLLSENAKTARQKALFRSEREKIEAELTPNPLTFEKTFANFGLMLGTIPPISIFARFLMDSGNFRNEEIWIFGLVAIVISISATVGYFSGKLVGKTVRELEKMPWMLMMGALPFIGMLWGIAAGGAGGLIIFVFGAVFGAMFGAAVGSIALPLFVILHRLMKKGEMIDRKHFLPFAFGVSLLISAFILGL